MAVCTERERKIGRLVSRETEFQKDFTNVVRQGLPSFHHNLRGKSAWISLVGGRVMNRLVYFWLTAIFGIGALLAITGLLLRATIEVLHHRGAETYVNAQGMQVHWVDVLTMTAAVLAMFLVLLVATAFNKWRNKRDAALIEKLVQRGTRPVRRL